MTDETPTERSSSPEQNTPTVTTDNTSANTAAQTPKKAPEARRAERFHVKWRAAVALGAAPNPTIYHGWLKDISTSGTAIFSEKTIPHSAAAVLHIEMPKTNNQPEHILTLKVRIVYGVYDASANQFRTGIEFIEFSHSDDKKFLETYLNKHCHRQTH